MQRILTLLLCMAPALACAESELFDATSLAKRYGESTFGTSQPHIKTEKLAAIEPAAGPAEDAPGSHGAAAETAKPAPEPSLADEAKADAVAETKAKSEAASLLDADIIPGELTDASKAAEDAKADGEAKSGEHGDKTPRATGHSEAAKSFAGKDIGKMPELPKVMIGGQVVMTNLAQIAKDISDTTPAELKGPDAQAVLEQRVHLTTYAHSPVMGSTSPSIQVIEFVDLSCGQCLPELAKIDAALADHISTTQVIHVHAPTLKFQDTNLPAFYGKVAARMGKFWDYRAHLISDNPTDDNAIFDTLVKSGVSARDARTLMLNEARRFYRELDADSLLARAFNVSKPPVLFVNGIRVGEGGLPLEKLGAVLDYVDMRLKRGLPESPQ